MPGAGRAGRCRPRSDHQELPDLPDHWQGLGRSGDQQPVAVRMESGCRHAGRHRSEEHTSELQSLMRISYAVFCLKKKKKLKTSYPIPTPNTNADNTHKLRSNK